MNAIYIGPNHLAFGQNISYKNGKIISTEETSAHGLQKLLFDPAPARLQEHPQYLTHPPFLGPPLSFAQKAPHPNSALLPYLVDAESAREGERPFVRSLDKFAPSLLRE
jgi:hypothetical protein